MQRGKSKAKKTKLEQIRKLHFEFFCFVIIIIIDVFYVILMFRWITGTAIRKKFIASI